MAKNIKNFTIFVNEGWRDSAKLKAANASSGVFEEEDPRTAEVIEDLEEFEKLADDGFKNVFDKAFEHAQLSLFGDDFIGYLESRKSQGSVGERIFKEYEKFEEAFKILKTSILDDLEDVNLNEYP